MVEPRSEEDALRRILRITVDGQDYELRTLKGRRADPWKQHAVGILGRIDVPTEGTTAEFLDRVATMPADLTRELIVEYDHQHVLSGGESDADELEWLLDNADDQDLQDAVVAMWQSCFPLVSAARSAAKAFGPQIEAIVWQVIASIDQATTRSVLGALLSSRLPSGALPQPASSNASPTSSSSSTGPTATDDEPTSSASSSTSSPTPLRPATRTPRSRRVSGSAADRVDVAPAVISARARD